MDVIQDLQSAIVAMRDDMYRQFAQMGVQVAQVRTDMGLQLNQARAETSGQVNQARSDTSRQLNHVRADMSRQFDRVRAGMGRQFDLVNGRLDRLDYRVDIVDQKVDRHFTWVVGLQLTLMLAVMGTLLAAYLT
jgi:hypothetical protein